MSDNRTFWVKYREYSPVPIETHFFSDGSSRNRHLLNVAHLIEAYQSRRGSSLANVDSGLISVHIGNNNDLIIGNSSDALEVDSPLAELNSGNTAKTALIIKTNVDDMEVDKKGI